MYGKELFQISKYWSKYGTCMVNVLKFQTFFFIFLVGGGGGGGLNFALYAAVS